MFSIFIFITSLVIAVSYYKVADAQGRQYFNHLIEVAEASILKRYFLYEQSLRGGQGLFNASNFVGRDEWGSYVETLRIEETLPGIHGIGYIEHVMAGDLGKFLQGNISQDGGMVNIYPQTSFDDKFIVKYFAPENENAEIIIGQDIGFEPKRRAAAERARDTGKPALTKKIKFVEKGSLGEGFLLLLPFYKSNVLPIGVSERRKSLLGWVYAPFISDDFFHDLGAKELSFVVYDGQEISAENQIYKNFQEYDGGRYSAKTKLKISGHTWTLIWTENNYFLEPANTYIANIIGIVGLFISILSFFIFKCLGDLNKKISRQVKVHEGKKYLQKKQGRQKKSFWPI